MLLYPLSKWTFEPYVRVYYFSLTFYLRGSRAAALDDCVAGQEGADSRQERLVQRLGPGPGYNSQTYYFNLSTETRVYSNRAVNK